MSIDWDDVVRAGMKLQGCEAATSYGRPALKVRGKVIACEGKSDGHFVLMLDMARVEFLLEMEPDVFFQTPHYVGWPCLLVHYAQLSLDDLPPLLTEAWARRAAKAWLS
jgi:hypothetical protein